MQIRKEKIETAPKYIDTKYAAGDPVEAIEELIYNALDASATRIDIFIKRNILDSVEEVIVADNGEGFFIPQGEKSSFLQLGISDKKFGSTNKLKRLVHGKKGEGRFKAFALGKRVEWHSKELSHKSIITMDLERPFEVIVKPVSSIEAIKTRTGTLVKVYVDGKLTNLPNDTVLKERLEKYFLTVIEDKHVEIYLNNDILSVEPYLIAQDEKELLSPINGVSVRTILWKTIEESNNKCFWCDKDGNTLLEDKLTETIKKTNYSIYIKGNEIEKAYHEDRLRLWSLDKELDSIKRQATDIAEEFIITQDKLLARDIIRVLQEEDLYPYADSDKLTKTERCVKEVYDRVLIKLNEVKPAVFKLRKTKKKAVIDTLKLILEKDPENFLTILRSLLQLSPEEGQKLAELLDKIPLTGIIKAAELIVDRLSFIRVLKDLVYGDLKKHLKERSQLHKIIEKETWIFGERYRLARSDQSFNTIIKTIRSQRIKGFVGNDVVEGGQRIPDLFFTQKYCCAGEKPYALIVELKRPSVKIGKAEIQQIKDYYDIIRERQEFSDWRIDFIIVSSEFSDNVVREIVSTSAHGLLSYCQDTPHIKVFVRKWSAIIDDNEGALERFKQELDIECGEAEGKAYLHEHYGSLLER